MIQNGHEPQFVSRAMEAAAAFYWSQPNRGCARAVLYSFELHNPIEYREYLSLGSPARFAKRAEEWVCFFPVRPNFNEPGFERAPSGMSRESARTRNNAQIAAKSILWFCRRAHIENILQKSLDDPTVGSIDAVRDRLGLAHFRPGTFAAVRIWKLIPSEFVTVPTTLDVAGYEHFAPAAKSRNGELPRTGRTAPLDGSGRGVREVIVWVDEPTSRHASAQRDASPWGSATLLMDRENPHQPRLFTVHQPPQCAGYFRRRDRWLGHRQGSNTP